MDLTLKQILNLVREHELSELEVEQDGLRLKIRKDSAVLLPAPPPLPARSSDGAVSAAVAPTLSSPPPAVGLEHSESDIELAVVKSPIVGTFYRSTEPGRRRTVESWREREEGRQVLCISSKR
jgi:acetyl-CoA carboxylase biotin carboxyl carrier protein